MTKKGHYNNLPPQSKTNSETNHTQHQKESDLTVNLVFKTPLSSIPDNTSLSMDNDKYSEDNQPSLINYKNPTSWTHSYLSQYFLNLDPLKMICSTLTSSATFHPKSTNPTLNLWKERTKFKNEFVHDKRGPYPSSQMFTRLND